MGFIDQALLQLHEGAALTTLLKGPGPAPYPHLERLIASVYSSEGATLHSVTDVTVASTTPALLVAGRDRIVGSIVTTQPGYVVNDLRADLTRSGAGPWADLMASVDLHAVVATDSGGVASAVTKAIENITSLDDFASRFRYLDLPAYLAAHRITTVEQLRESAEYILAEVRLRPPPPFDPADPAHLHSVRIELAVVLMDSLDLTAGLRAAHLLRLAGAQGTPGSPDPVLGPAGAPFAVAVVFPASALGPNQPGPAAVDALYARTNVLPLFANPP